MSYITLKFPLHRDSSDGFLSYEELPLLEGGFSTSYLSRRLSFPTFCPVSPVYIKEKHLNRGF